MERATVPTEGRPTTHPSWCDGGEPQVLREEAFPDGNVGGRVGAIAGWALFIVALCLLGVMSALFLATAANAQMAPHSPRMPCHNAAEIAKQLSTRYSEAPVAFGLQSNGNLLQVYFSQEKDTWTVVSTTPAGVSCIVAAGEHWESLPLVSKDPLA